MAYKAVDVINASPVVQTGAGGKRIKKEVVYHSVWSSGTYLKGTVEASLKKYLKSAFSDIAGDGVEIVLKELIAEENND